jgi:hypothetical protein
MDPASQDKTAFVTLACLYSFKVMPFGLNYLPATSKRLMETVLGDLRGKSCLVYLDDTMIYSCLCSSARHTVHLRQSKGCWFDPDIEEV